MVPWFILKEDFDYDVKICLDTFKIILDTTVIFRAYIHLLHSSLSKAICCIVIFYRTFQKIHSECKQSIVIPGNESSVFDFLKHRTASLIIKLRESKL